MPPRGVRLLAVLIVGLLFLVPSIGASGSSGRSWIVHAKAPFATPGFHATRVFAFASNFEDRKLDGWTPVSGTPTVVNTPGYRGEPSLRSTSNGTAPQYDRARAGFVRGDHSIYFQAAFDAAGGTGYLGLEGPSGPVATIGVRNSSILAGADPASAAVVGGIPAVSAQPGNWVVLVASVYRNGSGPSAPYLMDVFADRTDVPLATGISVPLAGTYQGAFLETTHGTVDYTDIIVSTYHLAESIPHFNPMEGYGQGSGTLVRILPAFTALTANETLRNWSTPERSILSFQINAMNFTGTVRSTCTGFFQLGADLEPNGRIAPWFVPGHACLPDYFGHKPSWTGFPSPNGTVLSLTIRDNLTARTIDFSVIDRAILGANRTWTSSISYNSTEFYGVYTQLEWQPSSRFPIDQYFLNGSMDQLAITGGNLSAPLPLGADYMVPFAIDSPLGWDFNYYRSSAAGYAQVA